MLPANLDYEAWVAVGRKVVEATGAAMWALGDWLAYGQAHYSDSHWGKRVPNELYAQIAEDTGYAEQTLANAKVVCLKLPLSRRRDKLTFAHATEIVSRVPEGQYEFWIEKTLREGLTRKALREQLRKACSTVRLEPGDVGTRTFLEQTRQFARDYSAQVKTLTPALRAELRKILAPVIEDLS